MSTKPKILKDKSTNTKPIDMEVHHHAHHDGKKTWKSYFWEFMMLFLAVFCGFMAEYQLEHVIEHQREKVYIQSMIEDAETDRKNIKKAIEYNISRINHLDTLANICFNYDGSKDNEELMYKHYIHGLIHPDIVSPTERTIMQLKSAGGMRLIRNKQAIDKIVVYDDLAKKLANQRTFYEHYQNNSINLAAQIFIFKNFGFNSTKTSILNTRPKESITLLSNDKAKLTEFGNQVYVYEGVVKYYNILLQEMDIQAEELIKTLKSKYHLK